MTSHLVTLPFKLYFPTAKVKISLSTARTFTLSMIPITYTCFRIVLHQLFWISRSSFPTWIAPLVCKDANNVWQVLCSHNVYSFLQDLAIWLTHYWLQLFSQNSSNWKAFNKIVIILLILSIVIFPSLCLSFYLRLLLQPIPKHRHSLKFVSAPIFSFPCPSHSILWHQLSFLGTTLQNTLMKVLFLAFASHKF